MRLELGYLEKIRTKVEELEAQHYRRAWQDSTLGYREVCAECAPALYPCDALQGWEAVGKMAGELSQAQAELETARYFAAARSIAITLADIAEGLK